MNKQELLQKSEHLADKIYDAYRRNKKLVNVNIDGQDILFKVWCMDYGLALYYGEDELNKVLSITAYGIHSRYFHRNEIINILTHFLYLIHLNINEYILKLNGSRYDAYIHQKYIRTPSREQISIKDFNWDKFKCCRNYKRK